MPEEKLTKQCKWFLSCPMNKFYQKGILNSYWIHNYCKGNWNKCTRFILEEQGKSHPDNMLPNGKIDENLQ